MGRIADNQFGFHTSRSTIDDVATEGMDGWRHVEWEGGVDDIFRHR